MRLGGYNFAIRQILKERGSKRHDSRSHIVATRRSSGRDGKYYWKEERKKRLTQTYEMYKSASSGPERTGEEKHLMPSQDQVYFGTFQHTVYWELITYGIQKSLP